MIENIGGRKFIFALVAILLAFGLTLAKVVNADEFLNFVEIMGGTYIVSNVVSKVADK